MSNRSIFFIGAYPRSRTAWVCNYFTAQGYLCLHEPLLYTRSIDDTLDLIETLGCGICDSTVPLMWPQIKDRFPESRIAIITRPDWMTCPAVKDVVTPETIDRLEANLSNLTPDAFRTDFYNLDEEIKALAEHCIPGFKSNPLIHRQCLRFFVQLTEKALKECLTPFEFTSGRKEDA